MFLGLLKLILLLMAVIRGYILLAIVFFFLPNIYGLVMGLLVPTGTKGPPFLYFLGLAITSISFGGLVYTAFAPPNRRY
jgi:hypothetical protein